MNSLLDILAVNVLSDPFRTNDLVLAVCSLLSARALCEKSFDLETQRRLMPWTQSLERECSLAYGNFRLGLIREEEVLQVLRRAREKFQRLLD